MSIGSRLKEARIRANLTREELAELVGVTKSAIGNYETEVSSPKEPVLIKLLDVLHIDANYVFQDMVEEPVRHPEVPKTIEARIVSFGMDTLPEAERQKILALLQVMYNNNPDLFKRSVQNDVDET